MKSMIQIGGKRERETEMVKKGWKEGRKEGEDWHTQGKTITYPSCTPGAHFHPSKRGKESHRLRYANYSLQSACIYMRIRAHTHSCVLSIYTRAFLILSTSITASPRDRGRVLALRVQHDENTMKQTGERECVRARTRTLGCARKGEREQQIDRYAMVKIYGDS